MMKSTLFSFIDGISPSQAIWLMSHFTAIFSQSARERSASRPSHSPPAFTWVKGM
ncbi:hypothetical protein D9M70_640170 [compost metagenome]